MPAFFRSLEKIRDASEEELAGIESMNALSARKVYEFFHPAEEDGKNGAAAAELRTGV